MIEAIVQQAIIQDNLPQLEGLVQAHGAIAIRLESNGEDLTALHLAAAAGHLAVVRYLLSEAVGADVRAARNNNFTPLHASAMKGHAEICEVLLQAGAEINVQTAPQGYAPLHSAAYAGHVAAIKMLLVHGANVELCNYRNERPIDTAQRQGQHEAVKVLLV